MVYPSLACGKLSRSGTAPQVDDSETSTYSPPPRALFEVRPVGFVSDRNYGLEALLYIDLVFYRVKENSGRENLNGERRPNLPTFD